MLVKLSQLMLLIASEKVALCLGGICPTVDGSGKGGREEEEGPPVLGGEVGDVSSVMFFQLEVGAFYIL